MYRCFHLEELREDIAVRRHRGIRAPGVQARLQAMLKLSSRRLFHRSLHDSNLQWYLSNSGITVHLIAMFQVRITREAFENMVRSAVLHCPCLAQCDLRAKGIHATRVNAKDGHSLNVEPFATFSEVDSLDSDIAAYLTPAFDLFDNPSCPAFRAECWVRSDSDQCQPQCVMSFVASHALVDGIRLGEILRGHSDQHQQKNRLSKTRGFIQHAVPIFLAPWLALGHILLSFREKRTHVDFSFATLRISRDMIRISAANLGVSQRCLLFASVLYALATEEGKEPFMHVVYAQMNGKDCASSTDLQLHSRVNFLSIRSVRDFTAFVRSLDRAMGRKDRADGLFQDIIDRLMGTHRVLQSWFPRLYSQRLFDYAPYDFELSLLPPLHPQGDFLPLAQADLYGACYNGTTPACIFLPHSGWFSLGIWIETRHLGRIQRLKHLLDQLGDQSKTIEAEPVRSSAK